MADSIIRIIKDNLEDGDSIVELAEKFVNDDDVEQQHPELNKLFQQVLDAANNIHAYLDR